MEKFSKDLQEAIEKGEVVIYEETKQARVSVDTSEEKEPFGLIMKGHRNLGLRAELEHLGYKIVR